MEYALLTGLGLAAPAGLNAYLPLLILALAERLSSAVTLERPYNLLASAWGIGVLLLLLTVEIVVDKVPGLDHANDLLQSPIRPAVGAVLTMAVTAGDDRVNPVVALLLGLVVAASVHAAKALTRPAITVGTGGLGNPLLSIAEDTFAALAALVAIFLPLLSLGVFFLFAAFVLWALRRTRRAVPRPFGNGTSTTLRRDD